MSEESRLAAAEKVHALAEQCLIDMREILADLYGGDMEDCIECITLADIIVRNTILAILPEKHLEHILLKITIPYLKKQGYLKNENH